MKVSQAFYSSLKFVMDTTSIIFSLGHPGYFPDANYFIIGLCWLGQLAKYVIGFPIGIIVGVFAACIIGLVNLFKHNKIKINDMNELHATAAEDEVVPASLEETSVALSDPIKDLPHAPNEPVQPPFLSEEEKLAKKTAEINEEALVEKKDKLQNKAELLMQFINQKIAHLQPKIDGYEATLKRIGDLTSQLRSQENIAANANQYKETWVTTTSAHCPCGFSKTYAFGLLCPCCHGPILNVSANAIKTTYEPDIEKRQAAEKQCLIISAKLNEESIKFPDPPADYVLKKNLVKINSELSQLVSSIQPQQNETDLLTLLLKYKELLAQAEIYFSPDDHFNRKDFLPISDYAQHYVATKMLQQLTRNNIFFQSTPHELQEIIARCTVSATFPDEDARHMFANC